MVDPPIQAKNLLFYKIIKILMSIFVVINQQILQNVNQSWQTLANPANSVDYSSHLLSATLPISIQHFLKYSETIKKESSVASANSSNGIGSGNSGSAISSLNSNNLNLGMDANGINGSGFNLKTGDLLGLKNGVNHPMGSSLNHQHNNPPHHHNHHHGNAMANGSSVSAATTITTSSANSGNAAMNQTTIESVPATTTTGTSKKKKKKAPKEKKPRPKPGEIRETKALDGSTLYCCPECQMAYPERGLIEQHVISHAVERRFVCDICNAALKRKDHLTRHKLSHIPDRPHVCNVSMNS